MGKNTILHKLILLCLLIFSSVSYAEIVDTYPFQSAEIRARAVNLAKSLRCPQCQNQNLLESNSPIAYDLRIEVYKMADAGSSDQQIIEQMTARFGDFVRYDPPFKTTTLFLWLAPFGLLLLAVSYLWAAQRYKKTKLQSAAAGQQTIPLQPQQSAVESTQIPTLPTMEEKRGKPIFSFYAVVVVTLVISFSTVLIYSITPRYTAWQQGLEIPPTVIISGAGQRQNYIQELQNALTADYNNGENWYQLGLAYLQTEQYANALESFSRAEYLLGANSDLLASAATALYYQNGQKLNDKARSWLKLALQQDPQQTQALSLLAAEAFAKSDYQQAAQYWRQILAGDSQDLDRRNLIQNLQAAEMLGSQR